MHPNWGYNYSTIVTLFIRLVTKSHVPPSRVVSSSTGFGLRGLGCTGFGLSVFRRFIGFAEV